MGSWERLGALALLGWALASTVVPAPCEARSHGITAKGCNGCHTGGQPPEIRLTAQGEAMPGQALTVLLEIEAKNGPVGGFYMVAEGGGVLTPIAGQGTKSLGDGIVHSEPKSGSGFVRFEVSWLAPAEPTGVLFSVWAVSANDSNSSGGDGAGTAMLSVVSGCDGELYFRDSDRDGYGSSTFGTRLDCEQRDGYTTVEGDCNENNADINPSAEEFCNKRDDDCDGTIDEGSMPQPHYPDADGDGHGDNGGEPVTECPPPDGYAPDDDDCYDSDATVYPFAEELCDSLDNDCDNSVDERVKPTCGVGWCRRESSSCSEEACLPGDPRDEECNAFDDDCDDVLDEGADCGAGMACEAGYCVVAGSEGGQGGGSGTAGASGSAAGGAGGVAGAFAGSGGASSTMSPDGGAAAPPASDSGGCAVLRLGAVEPSVLSVAALWLLSKLRRRRSA